MQDTENIEIVVATKADIGVATAILEEAADWAASKGLDLWQNKDFERVLAPAVERDELYLAKVNGQAAGTFILQWADEFFWGNWLDDAGYIHKVAVRREFAGKNIGGYILDWAECKVAQQGRPYLRLDCQSHNPTINSYYQKAGFVFQGYNADDRWGWNLYQKEVLK